MNKKLIVGNWKMNPASLSEAEALARGVSKFVGRTKDVDVVICPPFPYLSGFRSPVSNLQMGAQDIFWEEKGAFTGEVSAAMLKGSGAEYVIVGHSERRKWLGETDEMINKKVLAARKDGLKVILCVGEPASVRSKGIAAAKKFVKEQLTKDLKGLPATRHSRLVFAVAYEPIWAIGTGKADSPEGAAEMASSIKDLLATRYSLLARVLYGGSVTGANIARFIQYKDIDGALVGGASLNVSEFNKIIKLSSRT